MIGYFIVHKFIGEKDSAGFDSKILVASKFDMNIRGELYLPPYLRKSQSNIAVGDTVFGIMDNVTGLGVALHGMNMADFRYFFNADISIGKSLTVTNDITSTAGDVKATTVSLQNHYHPIITMTGDDAAKVVASASSGNPATFTHFATTVPGIAP